jgi:membrane protease YdiL (CAAX protease family)
MKEILHFLFRPKIDPINLGFSQKVRSLFNAIAFYICAKFIFALIVYLEKVNSFEGIRSILNSHDSYSNSLEGYSLIVLLTIAVPVLEEVAFRGFFTTNLKISLISISVLITLMLNFTYLLLKRDFPIQNSLRLFISIIFLLCCLIYLRNKSVLISNYINRNTQIIFYAALFMFTCIHIPNYNISNPSISKIFFFLIVLSQYTVLGIAASYLRFKSGLLWAIGFHSANNVIASIPFLLENFE